MTQTELDTMRNYELGVLLSDAAAFSAVVALIAKHGGAVLEEGTPNRIALAYRINAHESADFAHVQFSLDPAQIAAFEAGVKAMPEVIRMLLITPPITKAKKQPSAGAPFRAARASRSLPAAAPEKSFIAPVEPLSNEALEKKIEEILK